MDVDLFQAPDGGEITFKNGLAVMSDGLPSAVYLSLFGGNELDSGEEGDDSQQWWGNCEEQAEARKYRSRTQYLLRALPAIPANLRQVEDAMVADTAWMLDEFATRIECSARLVAPRRVELEVSVSLGDAEPYVFTIPESWGA
jgi:phage gp46-like protein